MDVLNDGLYQPLTAFLPSDGAMAALPQEQKDFLFHQDNRPQLVEYLKYHILQSQKVSKTGTPMVPTDSTRWKPGGGWTQY